MNTFILFLQFVSSLCNLGLRSAARKKLVKSSLLIICLIKSIDVIDDLPGFLWSIESLQEWIGNNVEEYDGGISFCDSAYKDKEEYYEYTEPKSRISFYAATLNDFAKPYDKREGVNFFSWSILT